MKKNKIAIIGLGYIGLPLALSFSKKFSVIGFDVSKKRINQLNHSIDINREFTFSKINSRKKNLIFTNKHSYLKECNFYIVTVPTPVYKNNKPNLNFLKTATKTISKYLKHKDTVVYESTVYPGVTENFCAPILEKYSKLKLRNQHNQKFVKDNFFYIGYSPERINPGDKNHTLENIPKIISASTNDSGKQLKKIYESIIKNGVYLVNDIKVAEAAKVIENTQRDINIAFINELSIIFRKLNIDTLDVLKAASTKWNFLKFYPGLVGGHCISVDPYYLSHKANKVGYKPKLIMAARNLNNMMFKNITNEIQSIINSNYKNKKIKILLMGITFKEDCSDLRNSQVLNIYNYLKTKNYVDLYDPNVEKNEVKKYFNTTAKDFLKKK